MYSSGFVSRLSTNNNIATIIIKEVQITAKSKARELREQAVPVSVISIKDIQGTVSNINDVLTKVSGIKIRNSGGVGSASRISVRGLEGKRVGFFIDGAPILNS
jgi:outer membrane cobalamin receptor